MATEDGSFGPADKPAATDEGKLRASQATRHTRQAYRKVQHRVRPPGAVGAVHVQGLGTRVVGSGSAEEVRLVDEQLRQGTINVEQFGSINGRNGQWQEARRTTSTRIREWLSARMSSLRSRQ